MAYETAHGRAPVRGPHDRAAARRGPSRREGRHQSTREYEAIPAPLADVVMRCLEKDAAQRPASASELLTALDSVSTPCGTRGSHRRIAARGRARPARRWILGVAGAAVPFPRRRRWLRVAAAEALADRQRHREITRGHSLRDGRRRHRERLPRRRHCRRVDHRPRPVAGVASRRPQLGGAVQGKRRERPGDRRCLERRRRSRRDGAARRKSAARDGRADEHQRRAGALERELRPRGEGRLRAPGRHHGPDHVGASR